jgi:hypothetical protein
LLFSSSVTNPPVEAMRVWKWIAMPIEAVLHAAAYIAGVVRWLFKRGDRGHAKSKAELRRDERRRRKELVRAARSHRRRAA